MERARDNEFRSFKFGYDMHIYIYIYIYVLNGRLNMVLAPSVMYFYFVKVYV
jgi:hypothetical protein